MKKDPRFERFKNIIKPLSHEESDTYLTNMEADSLDADDQGIMNEAKANGEMVLLTEIHDRIHGKRITLAKGIDEPVEEVDHPFLEMDPVTIPDLQTGQPLMTGEQVPTGAWLVQGGFPYHGIRYDMTRPLLAPGQ